MSLAQRSVRSTTYTIGASAITTVVQFLRSILLARLLAPEIFGIYMFASTIILISRAIPLFGTSSGLIHRAQESEGEIALRVHFTISLITNFIWGIGITILVLFFIPQDRWVIILVILLTQIFDNLTQTSKTLLIKRIVFRRIAFIDTATIIIGSVVAVTLAILGAGIWSLVATDVVSAFIGVIGYIVYRPVWKPTLGWSPSVARYLLDFGKRTFIAVFTGQILDYIDNMWTEIFLGDKALGFYSKAYSFSTYPRKILATPLIAVTSGTYAELKDQPKRLSQSFFRVNAFLIRGGFLISGLLVIIAPEFIRILLGVKWLPMLNTFRLLLIFAMLDPVKLTISSLFIAIGVPEIVSRIRLMQLGVMVAGLFLFGKIWGIEGVAIAVTVMTSVGVILLLFFAKNYVNFSIWKLFAVPSIGLITGIIVARVAIMIPGVLGSPWRTGSVKAIVFCALFTLVIAIMERKHINIIIDMVSYIFPRWARSRNEN